MNQVNIKNVVVLSLFWVSVVLSIIILPRMIVGPILIIIALIQLGFWSVFVAMWITGSKQIWVKDEQL
jgi:hypothetical protein